MWLAVNPSPKEGWGLTVIEANACGIPVIAADSPGLRDSVVHEKTGLLYPFGDINALAQSVTDLILNQQRRNAFTIQARKWAAKFSWDESASQMEKFITKIIDVN